ncbi:Gfo/Idh/MocA family protein [Adhaeretor mobilis]|uniref:Inositol 2-dehydrogenase n=1 Tax=Adhaeretor mobilis TaxID=1930276 RepID=A0A517MW60_9BACT|nr:Gfo/Idh/MocA family oxidoreductase [Adhaeretor mobilis]QDS99120.1 Inositol 2-dehydrogenase [Adhaeretor mobilis]
MTVSRRTFLRNSAFTTAAVMMPVRSVMGKTGANDRIGTAVVGIRGRGRDHIKNLGENVVALCDVDQQVLDQRADEFKQEHNREVATFTDYRRMLDTKNIDAVSIATPNHTHALIAIEAMQAGKDVYTEKPVSHNVWEGRQMVNAARKYNRIVQCGTQARSSIGIAEGVKFVQSGKLGKIQYAVGTCFKPRKSIGKLDSPLAIPDHIDYDLWCGPAAKVDLYRPQLHYDWHWDFNTGSGDMGNQGIHQMDIARWFLGEMALAPSVMSIGGRYGYDDAGDTPNTQIVYHNYQKAPLIFETRGLPRSKADRKKWGASMDKYRGTRIGVIIQCEQGYVLVPNYTRTLAYDNDGELIEEWSGAGNHFENFLGAVRSRKATDLKADILEGHISSSLCHTGNISHRLGARYPAQEIAQELQSKERLNDSFTRMAHHLEANEIDIQSDAITLGAWLEMEPQKEQFTNNDDANRLLRREGRSPFIIPDLS